jgi:hypothetical protein
MSLASMRPSPAFCTTAASLAGLSTGPAYRDRQELAGEKGGAPLEVVTDQFEIREPFEDLHDHDLPLESAEGCAEAEVHSLTEREVELRGAPQVEARVSPEGSLAPPR